MPPFPPLGLRCPRLTKVKKNASESPPSVPTLQTGRFFPRAISLLFSRPPRQKTLLLSVELLLSNCLEKNGETTTHEGTRGEDSKRAAERIERAKGGRLVSEHRKKQRDTYHHRHRAAENTRVSQILCFAFVQTGSGRIYGDFVCIHRVI